MSSSSSLRKALISVPLSLRYGVAPKTSRSFDGIAFYPRMRVLYDRVKKNANTTLVALLYEIEKGGFDSHKTAKKAASKVPLSFVLAPNDYDLLVTIRNPYTRVLSAFLQKFTYRRSKFSVYGDFEPTPAGFKEFLLWLESGSLENDGHWGLQVNQMLLPLSDYDFVIAFENLAYDLTGFLSERDLFVHQKKVRELCPTDEGKATDADIKLESFYDAATADIVRRVYRDDFLGLGYSFDFPEASWSRKNSAYRQTNKAG